MPLERRRREEVGDQPRCRAGSTARTSRRSDRCRHAVRALRMTESVVPSLLPMSRTSRAILDRNLLENARGRVAEVSHHRLVQAGAVAVVVAVHLARVVRVPQLHEPHVSRPEALHELQRPGSPARSPSVGTRRSAPGFRATGSIRAWCSAAAAGCDFGVAHLGTTPEGEGGTAAGGMAGFCPPRKTVAMDALPTFTLYTSLAPG